MVLQKNSKSDVQLRVLELPNPIKLYSHQPNQDPTYYGWNPAAEELLQTSTKWSTWKTQPRS